MAKDHSPYQRKVIQNYYRNRDDIETQRLLELVTEIALATTEKKRARLWERAAEILERTPDLEPADAARIVEKRDVEALARVAESRF